MQRRLRTARDAVAVRDTSAGAVPSRTMDYAPVGEDVAKEVIMLEVALGAEGSFFVRDEVVQQRLATEVAAAGGSREAATLKLVERKCNLQQQYNLSMAKLAKEGRLGRGNHIDAWRRPRSQESNPAVRGAQTCAASRPVRSCRLRLHPECRRFDPPSHVNSPDRCGMRDTGYG